LPCVTQGKITVAFSNETVDDDVAEENSI
jgi:hypothetical protein